MLRKEDLAQIEQRGSSVKTVEEQIERFKKGFPWMKIVAPATPERGIQVLDEAQAAAAVEYYEGAKINGKCKFVPASGAASRMFKDLFSGLDALKEGKELADTAPAAKFVEKVRINPGNYVDPARTFKELEYTDSEYAAEIEKIRARFIPFLNICKENGTAIRIGVNHGSLSDRIMCRYGNTPAGMVESCMEFLRICVEEQFRNVVLSIKASNTVVMVQTVRLLVQEMQKENMAFPVHLGVTEAGEGEDGRIKSAVGIGALLAEGIGDTIRVSLSEAPEKEIPVARKLVAYAAESAEKRAIAKAGIKEETIFLEYNESCLEDLQLKAAMDAGALLIDGFAKELIITNSNNSISKEQLTDTANAILQAARIRFTKPEYISCPGCGRTLYNLEETIAKIKQATSHLVGVKIAIMGCIVNGPGEMADADFGYVGAGRGKISLYKGKECIEKNIPEENAVEKLLKLIEESQK